MSRLQERPDSRAILSVIAVQEDVGRTCKNLEYRVDFRPVSSLGGTLNGE